MFSWISMISKYALCLYCPLIFLMHMTSFWVILCFQPADKRKFPYGGLNAGRPVTPPRGATNKNKKKWAIA